MDLSNVLSIEFHFENCEIYKVEPKYIAHIHLENKKKMFDQQRFPNRKTIVSGIEICIKKEANKVDSIWMELKKDPFHRIRSLRDIVYLKVLYKNGEDERIICPWEGDLYHDNPSQVSYLDENGNLVIKIKENN